VICACCCQGHSKSHLLITWIQFRSPRLRLFHGTTSDNTWYVPRSKRSQLTNTMIFRESAIKLWVGQCFSQRPSSSYITLPGLCFLCVPSATFHRYLPNKSQPFFDSSSPIHGWFPSREWVVRLPAFLLAVGLSSIGAFLGSTIVQENRKRVQQARLRTA
jgi:dolichyl-phosphate mannosyltransferase polypeptide 2 regulatory subunit